MATIIALKYQKKDGTYITAANDFNSATVNENYRYVKFEKPATGNLLTWLEANAVRLPLEGTWVFNGTLSDPSGLGSATIVWPVNFKCSSNGISSIITSITLSLNSATDELQMTYTGYPEGTSSSGVSSFVVYGSTAGKWVNQAYRTITFTQPVQYQGNEEFVKWFTANAVQISMGKVTAYKLNESITCSTTQSLSGTGSNSRDLYAYNCTPYFTEIPIGSKILLSNGNLDDLTGITVTGQQKITLKTINNRRYLNPTLKMSMHYSKDVTVGNNTSFLIGNAETISNGMTMQGSGKVYCPSSMTYTTSNEILLFLTAPTGDLLTWLNTNATKI